MFYRHPGKEQIFHNHRTSHEISPSMPQGNEVTVEGRVSRKNKASETFLKANILISIAGVREKKQRSCAQHMLRLERFLPPD